MWRITGSLEMPNRRAQGAPAIRKERSVVGVEDVGR